MALSSSQSHFSNVPRVDFQEVVSNSATEGEPLGTQRVS